MKILGIIPARYASSRFPGKPLASISGKPMIQHVYERSLLSGSLNDLIVATDDSRIEKAVKDFNGKVLMTGAHHKSGTDRCAEVINRLEKSGIQFDVVVNIQGDEPEINPEQIDLATAGFRQPEVQIMTLAKQISLASEMLNKNVVKVILDRNNKALYFSRQAIPYVRNSELNEWPKAFNYYKHIGLYAYRVSTLKLISQLEMSSLEVAESLEQLRWLENGFPIHVSITTFDSISVDTPEDLSKFSNIC